MKMQQYQVVLGLLAMGGVVTLGVRWVRAGETHGGGGAVAAHASQAASVQPGGGGVMAYINPETGEPDVPPPGAALPQAGAALAFPAEQMVEVPNPGPGGGYMIDTSGLAFGITATIGKDGKATLNCDVVPSGQMKRKE
jgi:hypothetical protein